MCSPLPSECSKIITLENELSLQHATVGNGNLKEDIFAENVALG